MEYYEEVFPPDGPPYVLVRLDRKLLARLMLEVDVAAVKRALLESSLKLKDDVSCLTENNKTRTEYK